MPEPNNGLLPGFKFEEPSSDPAPTPTPAPDPKPVDPVDPKIELIPAGDPKPNPTPDPNPNPAPAINEEEIIRKILGEGHPYKSFAELESAKIGERLSELKKVNDDYVSAKSEIDKYKGRVALMESPQFISATKYANFVKDANMDIDFGTFQKLEKFDPKEMKSVDAIILLDYLKNGEMGRTREEIMQQYKLGDYAAEIEDEEGNKSRKENAIDQRNLEREAVSARKELSQYKDKIANFKPEIQDTSAERIARQEEWKQADVAKKIIPYFKGIDTPIKEIKGVKIDAQYQFTPEDQVEIEKEIQREIEARDVPLNKENLDTIYNSVMATMAVRKDKERFEVFANKLWASIDMALKTKYSNYQGLDFTPERKAPPEKQTRTDGAKTIEELMAEQKTDLRRR